MGTKLPQSLGKGEGAERLEEGLRLRAKFLRDNDLLLFQSGVKGIFFSYPKSWERKRMQLQEYMCRPGHMRLKSKASAEFGVPPPFCR
jgi:hypothetical protein